MAYRVDLHSHTRFSIDSLSQLEAIVRACVDTGLDGLAVTDHNTIAGAQALSYLAPFPIIVGEEIFTREGEIIGLFLQEEISRGLTPEETIARIRDQGGLVVVPHPLDRFRRSRLELSALRRVVQQVDAIEVFNAHTTMPADNKRARELALSFDLAQTAGSDAHTPHEVGRAYVELDELPSTNPQTFLQQLRRGRVGGRASSPTVHVHTALAKLRKRLLVRR